MSKLMLSRQLPEKLRRILRQGTYVVDHNNAPSDNRRSQSAIHGEGCRVCSCSKEQTMDLLCYLPHHHCYCRHYHCGGGHEEQELEHRGRLFVSYASHLVHGLDNLLVLLIFSFLWDYIQYTGCTPHVSHTQRRLRFCTRCLHADSLFSRRYRSL